jgi:hypothetical protein
LWPIDLIMIKLGQRRDQPWSSVTESSGLSATGWSLVLSGKPTYFDDGWFDPDDPVSVKPDSEALLSEMDSDRSLALFPNTG